MMGYKLAPGTKLFWFLNSRAAEAWAMGINFYINVDDAIMVSDATRWMQKINR